MYTRFHWDTDDADDEDVHSDATSSADDVAQLRFRVTEKHGLTYLEPLDKFVTCAKLTRSPSDGWKSITAEQIQSIADLLNDDNAASLTTIGFYLSTLYGDIRCKRGADLLAQLLQLGATPFWIMARLSGLKFRTENVDAYTKYIQLCCALGYRVYDLNAADLSSLKCDKSFGKYSASQIKLLKDVLVQNADYFVRTNDLCMVDAVSGDALLTAILLKDVGVDALIDQIYALAREPTSMREVLNPINRLLRSIDRQAVDIPISTLSIVTPATRRMFSLQKQPADLCAFVQQMVDESRAKLMVLCVEQVDNPTLAALYEANRTHMVALGNYDRLDSRTRCENDQLNRMLGVDDRVNERLLFHGCPDATIDLILKHGFDERYGKERLLFGPGTYFADDVAKSLEYAQTGADNTNRIIIARVCLGNCESVLRAGDDSGAGASRARPIPGRSDLFYDSRRYLCPHDMPLDRHGFSRHTSESVPNHNEYICLDPRTNAIPAFVVTVKQIV